MESLEALYTAIEDDDLDQFMALLQRVPQGGDIDWGYILAVKASQVHARVRFLDKLQQLGYCITHGTVGNAPRTPTIFTAIHVRNQPAVAKLVEAKADLEQVANGFTPLTYAVNCRTYECAKTLVDAGANPAPPGIKSAMDYLTQHCEAQLIPQSDIPKWLEICSPAASISTRSAVSSEAVANALLVALSKRQCTFSVTSENFVEHPNYFECTTCKVYICESCQQVCHLGHQTVRYPRGEMYCDCGSETYNATVNGSARPVTLCRCLPKMATATDLAAYKRLLAEALLDKEITPEEDALLKRMRDERGISIAQHERVLAEFSLTKEAFAMMYVPERPMAPPSTAVTTKVNNAAAQVPTGTPYASPYDDQDLVVKVQHKFALIVANSNYKEVGASLANPVNDGRAMAQALQKCGFDVTLKLDVANRAAFESLVQGYLGKLREYKNETCLSLFFYAGHAIEILGRNYFLHTDYTNSQLAAEGFNNVNASSDPASFMKSFFPAQDLIDALSDSCTINIIILDACRNNPFRPPVTNKAALKGAGSKSGSASTAIPQKNGISAVYPKGQAMMVMAAAPGHTAADGSSENKNNGLFTQALLQFLPDPNLDIENVLFHTRRRVYALSQGNQQPWVHSALLNRVYLWK